MLLCKPYSIASKERQKRDTWRKSSLALAALGGLASTHTANAATAFNIARNSADAALIEFAQQADLTIIFPFEKVRNRQANALMGAHEVSQAIDILLRNTGLVARFNEKGALTIQLASDIQTEQQRSPLETLLSLFSESGDDLVTYPAQDNPYELILVKGMRASMRKSMDVKHESVDVVDVITAEDMGKFPDLNLAESLQRITGVSIDRAEGEGQLVTVRGLGPQFNRVLINGRQLATDNLGREFSFDTLASELVSGVTVQKTFSARQVSGGIGSVINIQTARPMARRGFNVAGSVKAVHDTNRSVNSPQGSLLISNSNPRFGWLMALSHQERKTRIDEAQIDGWLLNTNVPREHVSSTAANLFVPRNYDQRVRFDDRTRTGGTLVLQYRPRADLDLTFDYLTSRFDVETSSTSMGHWFTSSNLEQVETDDNGTALTFSQSLGHATDFHARTFDRPSSLNAHGFNLAWHPDADFALTFDISMSDARIDDTSGAANALSLIGYLNRSRFDHSAGLRLPAISGFESAAPDILNGDGVNDDVSDYLDPANGKAHVMLRRGWDIRDDFDQFRLDTEWSAGPDYLSDIRAGVGFSRQQKRNNRWDNEQDAIHCTFCGYSSMPDLPNGLQQVFDAGDDFLSGASGYQQVPHQWLRHDGEALFAYLESVSGISFDAVQRNDSFSVKEQIWSAYLSTVVEGELARMPAHLRLGLRFEASGVVVAGVEADLRALTILDQTELGQVTETPRPIESDANYRNWLPSANLRLELTDSLTARASWSRSVTRPTMSQMSPSLVLNTTRQGGDLRASSGNPQLAPFVADNTDLALEWFYAEDSYASINYFSKTVDNFIVRVASPLVFPGVTDPSTGTDPLAPDAADEIARFTLTQPQNAETATVNGWEFALQHNFDVGLGIQANMTRVDSNAELDRNNLVQTFALTGLSDTQNIILYYERERWQARIAWNYRDGFLQSLVQNQGAEPTFVDHYNQVDISASYAISEHWSVFVEGINITDEYLFKHGRFDNQLLLAQDPGARYSIGTRVNF